MKINAVISKPNLKFDLSGKIVVFSAVIIAVGIILGAVIYSVAENELIDSLCSYFLSFVTDFTNKNKPEIISGLIFSNFPYLLLMLIFGTNVVGTIGAVALTFAKSMGLGVLFTYIYDSFALKGVEYCLLILLPGKFIMIFAMILLMQSCLITSNDIRKCISAAETRVVPLHKFALRSLIITSLFLVSSVVDYLTLTSFSSLFNFNQQI